MSRGPCPAPSNTLDCIPADGLSHSIGTVLSAPDGTLWIGSGDARRLRPRGSACLPDLRRAQHGRQDPARRPGRPRAARPLVLPGRQRPHARLHEDPREGVPEPVPLRARPNGGLAVGDVGWNTREEVDLIGAPAGATAGLATRGRSARPAIGTGPSAQPSTRRRGPPRPTSGLARLPARDAAATRPSAAPSTGDPRTRRATAATIFFADFAGGFIRRLELAARRQRASACLRFATNWKRRGARGGMPNGDLAYADGRRRASSGSSTRPATARRPPTRLRTPTSGPAPLAGRSSRRPAPPTRTGTR